MPAVLRKVVPGSIMLLALGGLSPAAHAGTAAYIEQVGQYDDATIEQEATEQSSAAIRQYGSGNRHQITQRNGSHNHAEVVVIGDQNGATSSDSVGGAVLQQGSNQTALVRTVGYGNGFRVTQAGSSGANLAVLAQTGTGNNATVDQTNTSGGVGAGIAGTVVAEGKMLDLGGSLLSLSKGVQYMSLGDANATLQFQVGHNNTVQTVQNGSSNLAVQGQIGNNNVMALSQQGNGNTFANVQLGDDNVLQRTQIGNGIAGASVTQSGGSAIAITEIR